MDYKEKVKKELYKNYFTRLHDSEKHLEVTATKILNKDLVEFLKSTKKKKILDAGCGDGLFMKSCKEAGFDCTGLDSNDDLLSVSKKKGFSVVKGDLSQKLPFNDNSFDAVFCSNVLEHLEEPEFTIYELLRVVKKDGIVILTVPEANSFLFYDDWTHIRPFVPGTIHNLMKCYDVKSYNIKRRHFPIFVRQWRNPLVKLLNLILKKGPFAALFTKFCEGIIKTRRHDLVIMIYK